MRKLSFTFFVFVFLTVPSASFAAFTNVDFGYSPSWSYQDWTVPSGLEYVDLLLVAGGGGGGGSDGYGDNRAGGGGGSGGWAYITPYAVTAGKTVRVSVGAGGARAAWTFNGDGWRYLCDAFGSTYTKNANSGGNTSVTHNGVQQLVTGGIGGIGNTGDKGDGVSGAGGTPNGVAGGVISTTRNTYPQTPGGLSSNLKNIGIYYGKGGESNGWSGNTALCPSEGWSGLVRIRYDLPDAPVFSAPTCTMQSNGTFNIQMGFSGVTGATSYPLRIQKNGGAEQTAVTTSSPYTFTNQTAGTYSTWGHARNSYGWSPSASGGSVTCTVPNAEPKGFLDGADCSNIWGWAYDPDVSSSPITVHLYRGGPYGTGTFVGAYSTDTYRSDVNAAYGITGNHGFTIPVDKSFKTGTDQSIYVYALDSAGGTNPLISGSPKSVNCTAGLPDLIVSALTPTSVPINTSKFVEATVTNQGDYPSGRASAFLQQAYSITGAGAWDTPGTMDVPALSAGGGTAVIRTAANAPTQAGNYYFRICADKINSSDGGVITEKDENNNCGPWTKITVEASCVATTINNCSLPSTASGDTSGSCSSGYTGACNYTCTDGTWSVNSNSCVSSASLPTVTTSAVSNITQTGATSGGTITSNGGATVTVSGIAWSTSANPTTSDSKTTNGWATGGPWSSSMTGLAAGTKYHVRAYATNSAGTAYGSDVSFTTSSASSCGATTIGNCVLTSTASGDTSGSCTSGYGGSCSYSCSNGTWSQVSNSCVSTATASLSASPASITSGQSSTLTWSSTNATSCTAAGGFSTGNATSGSVPVSPSTTSTYSITCTGPGGTSAPANATVTVVTPTLSISANPNRVKSGGSVDVSWEATDVGRCAVTRNGAAWKSSNANGANVVRSSSRDTVVNQTTYVLSCSDVNDNPISKKATVTVNLSPGFQEF